jgi:hypothetical protein
VVDVTFVDSLLQEPDGFLSTVWRRLRASDNWHFPLKLSELFLEKCQHLAPCLKDCFLMTVLQAVHDQPADNDQAFGHALRGVDRSAF